MPWEQSAVVRAGSPGRSWPAWLRLACSRTSVRVQMDFNPAFASLMSPPLESQPAQHLTPATRWRETIRVSLVGRLCWKKGQEHYNAVGNGKRNFVFLKHGSG